MSKKPRTGERQKRVNDNYRAGWDAIWRQSVRRVCADRKKTPMEALRRDVTQLYYVTRRSIATGEFEEAATTYASSSDAATENTRMIYRENIHGRGTKYEYLAVPMEDPADSRSPWDRSLRRWAGLLQERLNLESARRDYNNKMNRELWK